MKKKYEAPEMEIAEMKMVGMLCTSIDTNVTDEDFEDVSDSGEPGAIAE